MQQKLNYPNPSQVNRFNYLQPSLSVIEENWQDFLLGECYQELLAIDAKLTIKAQQDIIYPPRPQTFNALKLTPLFNTKVVILGQDPYHGDGEANGLAFAVNAGIKLPPSLKNIYKEISLEYNVAMKVDGTHLCKWATQGVLLLNSSLTVLKDRANSLAHIGWHCITGRIIHHISAVNSGVVFMLWGSYAKQKDRLIDKTKHTILAAPHPSPLSAHRGFLGCNHFQLANQYLSEAGKGPIDWIGQ